MIVRLAERGRHTDPYATASPLARADDILITFNNQYGGSGQQMECPSSNMSENCILNTGYKQPTAANGSLEARARQSAHRARAGDGAREDDGFTSPACTRCDFALWDLP